MRDFDSIYAGASRMVYWAAYGILKSESDAMDVSQNAFMRLLNNMGKLESANDEQVRAWLYRVTVNLCMDLCRKMKRELLTDETELFESAPVSEAELPEPAAVTAEQRESLRAAVDGLPDIYRQTVTLHYYSELPYDEIATLMGVSVGTVKSRMSRAKERLYAALKGGVTDGR